MSTNLGFRWWRRPVSRVAAPPTVDRPCSVSRVLRQLLDRGGLHRILSVSGVAAGAAEENLSCGVVLDDVG